VYRQVIKVLFYNYTVIPLSSLFLGGYPCPMDTFLVHISVTYITFTNTIFSSLNIY